MRRHLLLSTALLLCVLPRTGLAQVRHCVLANGTMVYTDQRCDAIGAKETTATSSAATPQIRNYRPACPRTLRDLAFEVTSAVEAHDVNRLAGVYLWDGIGTREGYALMDRLQAIVDRPLVDLQPVWPGTPDNPYSTVVPQRPPVALRLEQTSKRGSTPVRAVFGLRKHLDCWWIVEGGARRTPATAATPDVPPAPAQLVPPVD